MSRKIHWVIIHCSDSDIASHDNPETIRSWHHERGFSDIGYHYFLDKKGVVHSGRPEDKIGAHVRGHNSGSIGICLSGRREFTREQFESLERLLIDICKRHKLNKQDILAHHELDPSKSCPNFDLHKWLSGLEWH